jgi:archaeosortase A (PGF-CTERM-specific)
MPLWAYIALDLLLLASLSALLAGLVSKKRGNHLLRAAGWCGFGIYWGLQAPHYWAIDDAVNVIGCLMALPIFCFLGWHEYLSHRWDDEYPPLRFVGWAMAMASIGFFIVDKVPIAAGSLIYLVAQQSVWLLNVFGFDLGVQDVNYYGNPWFYKTDYDPLHEVNAPLIGVDINIVLACTAIQGVLVTGAFIFASRGGRRRKWLAFGVVALATYLVNLGRNAFVIWLTWENGPDYFDFAHNVIGKGLSLVALIVLVLYAFWLIPELYEDINGLFDLFWRKGPKHDYISNVGRVFELAARKGGRTPPSGGSPQGKGG